MTKKEPLTADQRFEEALAILEIDLQFPDGLSTSEVDDAAQTAIDFAMNESDKFIMARVLRVFSRYVQRSRNPPFPMLKSLAKTFNSFNRIVSSATASTTKTAIMDRAFSLDKEFDHRPKDVYQKRLRERCNAIAVCYWMEKLKTKSVRKAVSCWADKQLLDASLTPESTSTIRKDYEKYAESEWLNNIRERYKSQGEDVAQLISNGVGPRRKKRLMKVTQ